MAICSGNTSTITSATTPTINSASSSLENSVLARSLFFAPMLYPAIGIQPAAMPMAMEMAIWKNFITMPRTASGICAYSGCPKIGSRAPYSIHIFCTAAIETTSEICARKLVSPSTRNFGISFPSSLKLLISSLTTFMCCRYQMESAAVST